MLMPVEEDEERTQRIEKIEGKQRMEKIKIKQGKANFLLGRIAFTGVKVRRS